MSAVKTAFGNETDGLAWYFTSISRFPILTHAEEITLSQRREAGDEAAKHDMYCANLRLVVSVARRHRQMPLEDAIQEGNIGLMRAIVKYDWRLGYRFSTYAMWWIKQAIMRAVPEHQDIHVPELILIAERRLRAAHHAMAEAGQKVTIDKLIQATGYTRETITATLNVPRIISLDRDVSQNDSDDACFLDGVIGAPDDALESVADRLDSATIAHALMEAANLTWSEHYVLQERYCFDRSFDDIAGHWRLSRERIRQIEAHALAKLRAVADEWQKAGKL